MMLRILQIMKTSSYQVENSLNKFYYVGIVLLTSVLIAVSTHTTAASTTLASLGPMIVTPTPIPTPSITTPNTQTNLETLFRTLLTQELSSADSVVLTTELERILDDLAGGQYQISAEFEVENGEEDTETEKTLTITISPIGPTTPLEEEEAEPEEDSGGNGDDTGNDDPPEEPETPDEGLPGSPPF